MTIPTPDTLPEWATTDQVDPTSGINNVETPPTNNQTYGFGFQVFPPRQWFNWLFRWIYRWLLYLAQNDSRCQTQVFTNCSYGTAYQIADTQTPGRLLLLYIQDSSPNHPGDKFLGSCIPYSNSMTDRTVYDFAAEPGNPSVSYSAVNISVSTIDNATGEITVSTTGGGTAFTMVVQQFNVT